MGREVEDRGGGDGMEDDVVGIVVGTWREGDGSGRVIGPAEATTGGIADWGVEVGGDGRLEAIEGMGSEGRGTAVTEGEGVGKVGSAPVMGDMAGELQHSWVMAAT